MPLRPINRKVARCCEAGCGELATAQCRCSACAAQLHRGLKDDGYVVDLCTAHKAEHDRRERIQRQLAG